MAPAYASSTLTAAERNYPVHVLGLLAVVRALSASPHYLLGGGAPRPGDCWSDLDLRTDNRAITWLKKNRHLNTIFVRWLDEIEDFQFDVKHLPGSRNSSDPLLRRGARLRRPRRVDGRHRRGEPATALLAAGSGSRR